MTKVTHGFNIPKDYFVIVVSTPGKNKVHGLNILNPFIE